MPAQAKEPFNLTSSAASNGTHIVVRITNPNHTPISVNITITGLRLQPGVATVS
eukprot:COSAG02_NODE_49425_length_327_cov_0.491228_1_plen_53_part_10